MKNFIPQEERAEIERLARMIFKSLHHPAWDPEMLVSSCELPRLGSGHVLSGAHAVPGWSLYAGAAKAVFDDMRRQEEEAEMAAASEFGY